jgi:vacuolar-type H+-ATPase subunit I/STV1
MLLVGGLMVTTWKSPPIEKLEAAEKAVNEARSAGAPSFFADDFTKMESQLGQARQEIEVQNAKLGFLRSYEMADHLLSAVLAEASRLLRESQDRQESVKASAVQAQHAAQEAVMAAQDLVDEAPAGKDRAALGSIKADLHNLATALPEVQAAIEARNYTGGQAKAQEIKEKANAIALEIQHALVKVRKSGER